MFSYFILHVIGLHDIMCDEVSSFLSASTGNSYYYYSFITLSGYQLEVLFTMEYLYSKNIGIRYVFF